MGTGAAGEYGLCDLRSKDFLKRSIPAIKKSFCTIVRGKIKGIPELADIIYRANIKIHRCLS